MTLDNNDLRIGIFVTLLCCLLLLELGFPKKQRVQARAQRWLTNLSLAITGTIFLRLITGISAFSVALYGMSVQFGIFYFIDFPIWLEILCAVIIFDFALYIQHVLSHKIPILWRFHKVHHADRDLDCTSGVRFHPVEIFLSMLYKSVITLVLGPLPIAIFIFETILSSAALFNHANIKIPAYIDRVLRFFIVTPDMHRIHHSVHVHETNSNYGFFLSIWDKLFSSYTDTPQEGHKNMFLGLSEWQSLKPSTLWWSLSLPFIRK